MQKQLLLILILSVVALAQLQELAVSGDGSSSFTVQDGSTIITDPPTPASLILGASPQGCSNWDSINLKCNKCSVGWDFNADKICVFTGKIPAKPPINLSAPSNFNFLDEKSLGNTAKWVSASSNPKNSIGLFSLTTFTINYNTFCPNQVNLLIAASNIFRVFHNNNLVQGWSFPWPSIHRIPLSPLCQCNTIRVEVFNLWYPSPAAIIYSLTQNTNGCFKCPITTQFWNYQSCKCECKRNCCPKGQVLSKRSCQCVKPIGSVSSLTGIIGV